MTQHVLIEDTRSDQETMRSLRRFVSVCVVAAILMAVGVTILAP